MAMSACALRLAQRAPAPSGRVGPFGADAALQGSLSRDAETTIVSRNAGAAAATHGVDGVDEARGIGVVAFRRGLRVVREHQGGEGECHRRDKSARRRAGAQRQEVLETAGRRGPSVVVALRHDRPLRS